MVFSETKIQKMMKNLDLTREEAIQLLKDDANDVSVELTKEQQKVAKQMAQGDRKKEETPRKRERKPDLNKGFLIDWMVNQLRTVLDVENISVLNKERELVFTYNGEVFKLVLSKPRAKKEEQSSFFFLTLYFYNLIR